MKKILSLLIVVLLLASCENNKNQSVEDLLNTNDLKQIRKKKSELDSEQQEIAFQIKQLETKIKELDPQEKVPLITTFIVKEEVFKHFVELQGNVNTKQNLIIYPEYSGILTRVFVKDGQQVSKGQKLAKIDDGGLSQQVTQLQIQADLEKTTFERQERLWNKKIGSEIQYLQAKSTYESKQEAFSHLHQKI